MQDRRENQRSIKKAVSIAGIGLHTGVQTRMTFKPAAQNTGIRFFKNRCSKCETHSSRY